jgi:hypothetical protein
MATITLNNSSLKKYLDLLRNLDIKSKKTIVFELTESIKDSKKRKEEDFFSLFGAWDDTRDSDDIIRDIKSSRVNNRDIESF